MPFYSQTFDFSGLDAIQNDIQSIEDTFADAMLDTSVDIENTYLPKLKEYPPTRAKHPFEFATPKSRRYYFHLVRTGQVRTDGHGYVRNGGYANSWRVDIEQSGNEYTIRVHSTFPASQYVGGNRQVPGHRNTGWVRYEPILDDISDYADRQFYETVRRNFV